MTTMTPPPLDQQDGDEMLVRHSEMSGGAQPMELAPVEAAAVAYSRVEDHSTTLRFTWTIEHFSSLHPKKQYSEVFMAGGSKWRLLIFAKGNNLDHLSVYLDVADSAMLPDGWSRYAKFSLSVVNQLLNKFTIRKGTQHQFNARESDWGFKTFMPLSDLYDPGRGYIVNDSCTVEAEVAVREVIGYWNCDSKEETGCVGLQNEGATCYMNSLLQTLYHIPFFRKAVYHMPTTEDDLPSGSIPLTLQSLFSKLQHSDSSVATKELTKSLGWDMDDSFIQHDVQELNRVLCQKLEDKMKGTVVEGTIQLLFEGHHMNYIQCINVDYKSTRKELFYDLQLDVKGCQDVYASFDKYCEGEWLEGDKKYHAEHHGLQDARKGVLFIDLPPVLQLHLKRFEYDFTGDTMVKINDRYEFPLHLDLDRDNGKYLSPDADRSVRNLYTLHSILVHSGEVHGGRYYAFIRPTLSDQWLKFDDERVTKEDAKKALEEHYGGKEELPQTNPSFNKTPSKFMKHANAYMLVYIRESDKDKIISNVDKKDIVEHLRIRLKKEQKEEEHKKEKAEAHPYTIIKVVRDDDLREQIGRDVYFDLVDHEKVRSFHIQKQLPFHMFKEKVAKEFGIPVQFQRFWLWARRENHTFRPQRSLTPQEEAQFVGQLREERSKLHIAELRLFLEVELGQNLRPVPPPDKTNEDILLFFKLYDPEEEKLRYVGRLFVKALGKPSDILLKLNEMAGFHPDEEIQLFEEICYELGIICEHIDKKLTFRSSQLEHGDIICYQITPEEQYRYPDVPSFFESIHIRQPVNAPRDEEAASTESEEVDAASSESEEADYASTESEVVEAHGVKTTVEGDVQGDKLTVKGDAPIPQHEDPTKGGEATSTEDQTLVREALVSDISVEATTEAFAQESAQGDGGERSVEPSTTTSVLQGEQGLVPPLASSAQPPALTSMSSAGASTSHSIKSELPNRLVDLSIEQIRDIIVEADAAGRTNLSDQLIPLYTLVEDLHSSQREVPLTALAELQKAREVAAQCRTEQEEIDKSLAAGELKVAALEATLTWAKGEVRELKRRRLALTPPAPQAIQTLRREAIKQEALNRLSRAKVEMLEVEYQKLLLSLE